MRLELCGDENESELLMDVDSGEGVPSAAIERRRKFRLDGVSRGSEP